MAAASGCARSAWRRAASRYAERARAELKMPIRFPKPHLRKIGYWLDDVLPGFFEEFRDALMPEDREPLLSMTRYMPGSLLKDSNKDPGEAALVGLVRSGLL